jgi:hypothetical protein
MSTPAQPTVNADKKIGGSGTVSYPQGWEGGDVFLIAIHTGNKRVYSKRAAPAYPEGETTGTWSITTDRVPNGTYDVYALYETRDPQGANKIFSNQIRPATVDESDPPSVGGTINCTSGPTRNGQTITASGTYFLESAPVPLAWYYALVGNPPFDFFAMAPDGGPVIKIPGSATYTTNPKEWAGSLSGVPAGYKVQATMAVERKDSLIGPDPHVISTGLLTPQQP